MLSQQQPFEIHLVVPPLLEMVPSFLCMGLSYIYRPTYTSILILQGFIELVALEDILEPYLDEDSRNNFELSKKHLGAWDIEGDER